MWQAVSPLLQGRKPRWWHWLTVVLSTSEQYSTARALGLYRCVSITAQYESSSPLKRETWTGWIWTALSSIVGDEPFLRVGIADEDSACSSFVYVPEIDLEKQVVWHEAPSASDEEFQAQLGELLEREHAAVWPDTETRPPWKVTIVDSSKGDSVIPRVDLVFSWHHAIGDGLSGKLFHERLLAALRERNVPGGHPPLESPVLRFEDAPALPPPQEEAVKFTVSWWFMLKTLWAELGPSFLTRSKELPWTGRPVNIHAPFKTKVRSLFVDGKTSSDVLAVCRMHGTTLTGLIHALTLLSLVRQLPSEQTFHSQTPISLRPYVSVPNFDQSKAAVLVTVFSHEFSSEQIRSLQSLLSEGKDDTLEQKMWEIAAGVMADLKRRAEELPADDTTGLLRYTGDLRERFKKMDGEPMGTTFEVSNIGVIDGGDGSEEVKITRLAFCQSGSQVGAAVKASVAGCKGSGGVAITWAWQDGVVEDELLDGVKEDLGTWMKNLARSGRLQAK